MMSQSEHISVLLNEAVTALAIANPGRSDGCYCDATFGRGGHSRYLLQQLGPKGRLLAVDKDPAAIQAAQEFNDARFLISHSSFANLETVIQAQCAPLPCLDGLLLDLGVSSPQLDDAERGFSFMHDGPLDMRMNPEAGLSAADWLAVVDEKTLATVLWEYGEERFSRRVAARIVRERQETPILTTKQLADIIAKAIPKWEKHKHPATRSFQAIRIEINGELDELKQVLASSLSLLKPGGRLSVISFHSLEDRIVKRFMRDAANPPDLPRFVPVTQEQLKTPLRLVGKAIKPSSEELARNPRARSAVLRVAERLED